MTSFRSVAASTALLFGLMAQGCASDDCESGAPTVAIDIEFLDVSRMSARSFQVDLVTEGLMKRRTFELGDELLQGMTSIAVEIEPPPDGSFDIEISVRVYDQAGGEGGVLGAKTEMFTATADACNRFRLALEDASRIDAGPDDDAGVPDVGELDAGEPDAGPADVGPACVETADQDTIALYTFEQDIGTSSLTDSAGPHSGTLRVQTPTAAWSPGPTTCGNALVFDGTGYAEIPPSPDFDLMQGSIDFWVNFAGTGTTSHQGILSRDASGTMTSGHVTIYRSCEGYVVVRIQDLTSTNYICSDLPIPARAWTHIGINFGLPEVEVFVDGMLSSNDAPIGFWDTNCETPITCGRSTFDIAGNQNPWVVGASGASSSDGAPEPVNAMLNGSIDSIRISRVRRPF